MSNDPYRRHNEPSNELARLAQQGQARLHAANRGQDSGAQSAADRNLRTALGAVRGAPIRRLVLVLLVLCMPVAVGGLIATFANIDFMPIGMGGIFSAAGLLSAYLLLPPMASRAGVEAERAWVASLPFALDWYFELLASDPQYETRVSVDVWWTTGGVDRATLQGVIALFDTESRVVEVHGGHASFTTGPISGMTGIRVNRVSVLRNHRLGTTVHRLVDEVLMPIHRNAPITRVKLSRGF